METFLSSACLLIAPMTERPRPVVWMRYDATDVTRPYLREDLHAQVKSQRGMYVTCMYRSIDACGSRF